MYLRLKRKGHIMRKLSDINGIRFKTDIKLDYKVTKKEFQNYFRTFKPAEESVEENSFYSPFFSRGDVIPMHEHYGDRVNPIDVIFNSLQGMDCVYLRIEYDFKFAAVNEEYITDGEFLRLKEILKKACQGTDFYIAFMVSHFNQLVGKPAYQEKEHYHILLGKSKDTEQSVKKLLLQLKSLNSTYKV